MKKTNWAFYIMTLCVFILIGCTVRDGHDFLQANPKRNVTLEQLTNTLPNNISIEVSHPFPFHISASVCIPTSVKSDFHVAEIAKIKLTKYDIQRLLDYFSNGNAWTNENGDPFVL